MSRPQATPRAARPGGSDGRRAELIEAARRVIQRRGFAKATVGAITGEAGASLGLLNYHFDSRDDVVAEAFAAAARADLDAAAGDLAPPRRSARARWPPTSTSRPGPTATCGACGSTRGARRCTPRSCAARSSSSSAAGAPCSPASWPTATASGCWRCADPEDAAGRLVAALDGLGPAHDAAPRRRLDPRTAARWARRLVELELGVTLPGAPAPEPARPAPTPHEERIPIRGRDLDATGRVHPAVLLTYVGEVREAWLDARLGGLDPVPRAGGRARVGRLPPRARAPRRRGRGALRARRAGDDRGAHARDDRDGGRGARGQRRGDGGRRPARTARRGR